MDIVGVEINDSFLDLNGHGITSTGHFRAFMCYCIDNYYEQIFVSDFFKKIFSQKYNDPMFGTANASNMVEHHNGLNFSIRYGNVSKIKRMKDIARALGFEVYVHTFE